MNLPNRLTLARLLLVPVFVVLMSLNHVAGFTIAYIVFVAASITDYYDGKIARQRNLVTNFGKLFDPLADKVLMAAAFVMMMKVPELNIPGWTIVAILAREFLVTGARSLTSAEQGVVAANKWGKIKTVIQMVYIDAFLFLAIAGRLVERWVPEWTEVYSPALSTLSFWAIVLVAAFTVYSGIQFARTNWQTFNLGSRT